MKYSIRIIAILIMVALPHITLASNEKLVIVDIQKILREAKVAKDVSKQIEVKKKQYQQEISNKEQELKNKDKELAGQQALLSPEAFEQQRKAFISEISGAKKSIQAKRKSLGKAYDGAVLKVRGEILKIVKNVAKKKGATLALPKSNTLYTGKELEITQEVLTALNKKLPTLKINFK